MNPVPPPGNRWGCTRRMQDRKLRTHGEVQEKNEARQRRQNEVCAECVRELGTCMPQPRPHTHANPARTTQNESRRSTQGRRSACHSHHTRVAPRGPTHDVRARARRGQRRRPPRRDRGRQARHQRFRATRQAHRRGRQRRHAAACRGRDVRRRTRLARQRVILTSMPYEGVVHRWACAVRCASVCELGGALHAALCARSSLHLPAHVI